MTHSELVDAIIQEASDRNLARLFKNHSGVAKYRRNGKLSTVRYGVGGTAKSAGHDLLGWRMSDGKFISIDAKVGRDKLSDGQVTWMRWVMAGGGLSGEARSVEQAMRIISGE